MSFIGSSEHEELVKIGGIHDLETDAKYGYDSVLDINTNIPFIVDDHTRARIKATRIATFEEMIPFLVNFFTHIYGGRTVKLKLYFTGCGKIGQLFTKEAGEGGYTYTELKDMDDAVIDSLSGATWDGSTPNIIKYDSLDALNIILRGHIFGTAGGARKTIKRRSKYRRSTKRTKKFANRRHIVRNRRSAPRRRTQI